MKPPTVADSAMLRRIADALRNSRPAEPVLRVSVAATPIWEPSPKGDRVLVRWLCWSINDGGREVVAPEFEAVHQDVTEERLREELPSVFTNIRVIVDDDIDM